MAVELRLRRRLALAEQYRLLAASQPSVVQSDGKIIIRTIRKLVRCQELG